MTPVGPSGRGDVACPSGTHPSRDATCQGRGVDDGSALVEAVVVIAVLLLPMLWLATALVRVEAASFAVRAAAREASRTYVTAASSSSGAARAATASRLAFDDQRAPVGTVDITCSAQPCLTPAGTVTARASTAVGLPFVPAWLSGGAGLQITLSSTHSEKVETYGGQR